MPATEAQMAANRKNARLSTGPKTEEGKAISRANAVTHGLTATTILPELEAAEVKRRAQAYGDELRVEGELGNTLVWQLARSAVRMDRCAEMENSVRADRVRKALAEAEVPAEVTTADQLHDLNFRVQEQTLFDFDEESHPARKYAQAAERSFFRVLKELRLWQKQAKATEEAEIDAMIAQLGSISQKDQPKTVRPSLLAEPGLTDEEMRIFGVKPMPQPPRDQAASVSITPPMRR